MTTTAELLRAELMKVLTDSGEEGMTISAIATALDCNKSSVQPILTELVGNMAIRSTQGLRNVRYWVPSPARLKAEEAARQVRVVPALKVDKYRRELYARLEAERSAIASIG